MSSTLPFVESPSTGIDGSFAFRPEDSFQPGLVGDVCQRIWGEKADAKVAVFLGVSDRATREYFSGRVAIPSLLLTAINIHLSRRPLSG